MSIDFSKLKDWDYLEEEVLINNITESDNSIEILKAKATNGSWCRQIMETFNSSLWSS